MKEPAVWGSRELKEMDFRKVVPEMVYRENESALEGTEEGFMRFSSEKVVRPAVIVVVAVVFTYIKSAPE